MEIALSRGRRYDGGIFTGASDFSRCKCYNRGRRLRLITLIETLSIPDIKKLNLSTVLSHIALRK